MRRGRPSARSIELAGVVIGAMRRHLGEACTDTEIARLLGVAQPNIGRALRLGLTPQAAADWSRAWAAAGHPEIGVAVVVTHGEGTTEVALT